MSQVVIRIEHVSKAYRLGAISHGTLVKDVQSWWARFRGREDPNAKLLLAGDARPVAATDGWIWALKDVSVAVGRGEVVGIIGRNGAGKSTLLKILSRVTAPSAGVVKVHGRIASLLEVGTGFHPELTGRENVYLNGAILGLTRAEIRSRLDEIVAFSEIGPFIDTPVKRYSSGMSVRLAFAVAAHLEPEILVVDEVLAVGDAGFREKCLGKMRGMTGEGRTVLFVSHDMQAVGSLCRRALLLSEGQLEADGPAPEIVSEYLASMVEATTVGDGHTSLVDHPGRRKQFDGLVQLTHCRVGQPGGSPSATLATGMPARISLGYKMNVSALGARPVFSIAVSAGTGERVTYLSSEIAGLDADGLKDEGEVHCTIPRLPLVPGRYGLSVLCRVGNAWSDAIYDAAFIEVAQGPFFESGLLPPPGAGGTIVLEHAWTAGEVASMERPQ
jgi:lipopolysaccharide transport system ATP-binding protein